MIKNQKLQERRKAEKETNRTIEEENFMTLTPELQF